MQYLNDIKAWEDAKPLSGHWPYITTKDEAEENVNVWKEGVDNHQKLMDELAAQLPVLKEAYNVALDNFAAAYKDYMEHKDDPVKKAKYVEEAANISNIIAITNNNEDLSILEELRAALALSGYYTTNEEIKNRIDLDLDIYPLYVLTTGNVECVEPYIKLAVAVGKMDYANKVVGIRGIGSIYICK